MFGALLYKTNFSFLIDFESYWKALKGTKKIGKLSLFIAAENLMMPKTRPTWRILPLRILDYTSNGGDAFKFALYAFTYTIGG